MISSSCTHGHRMTVGKPVWPASPQQQRGQIVSGRDVQRLRWRGRQLRHWGSGSVAEGRMTFPHLARTHTWDGEGHVAIRNLGVGGQLAAQSG